MESIGTGAYKLPNNQIGVLGGICALRQQLKLSVHIGGRKALGLKGYSHFGRINDTVELFLSKATHLPKWFLQYEWNSHINFKSTDFLDFDILKSFTSYEHRDM